MSSERLTDLLISNAFPATTGDGVRLGIVRQLAEIQALRGAGLTEEEWASWRRGILDGLVDYPHGARFMVFAVLACSYIPIGALIAAAVLDSLQWAVAGGCSLLGWAVMAWRQWRSFVALRGLTAAERDEVIDALAATSLVSPEEAADLRRRVREWAASA